MEPYIKDIVSEITYSSELTPPFPTTKCLYAVRKGGVKFAHITYVGADKNIYSISYVLI